MHIVFFLYTVCIPVRLTDVVVWLWSMLWWVNLFTDEVDGGCGDGLLLCCWRWWILALILVVLFVFVLFDVDDDEKSAFLSLIVGAELPVAVLLVDEDTELYIRDIFNLNSPSFS